MKRFLTMLIVAAALCLPGMAAADEAAAAARADAFLRPLREALDGLAVPA